MTSSDPSNISKSSVTDFFIPGNPDNKILENVPGIFWDRDKKAWQFNERRSTLWTYLALANHRAKTEHELGQKLNSLIDAHLLYAAKENRRSSAIVPTRNIVVPGLSQKEGAIREDQLAAIDYLIDHPFSFVADDVGLGKTIISLSTVAVHNAYPALVVCKSDLKQTWAKEIMKWFPERTFEILSGRKETGTHHDCDFIIINYDLLHFRSKEMVKYGVKAVIYDESHSLVSLNSQRSKAAVKLRENLKDSLITCLALSATPVVSAPANTVMQIKAIGIEDVFDGANVYSGKFGRRFCETKRKHGRWVIDGIANPIEYNQILTSTGMVRRTKRSVMKFLPPITYEEIALPLDSALAKKYVEAEKQIVTFLSEHTAMIAKEMGLSVKAATKKAEVRAKIVNSAKEVVETTTLRQILAVAKLEAVIDWIRDFLESNPEEKIVVPAYHTFIQTALCGMPIQYTVASGEKPVAEIPDRVVKKAAQLASDMQVAKILSRKAQKPEEREADKERFQTDPNCRMIVISIGSALEGHTLTAAWHVAWAELPWTASGEHQGIGRVWGRSNDPHPATSWRLLGGDSGTTDYRVKAIIEKKANRANTLIDGDVWKAESQETSKTLSGDLIMSYLDEI